MKLNNERGLYQIQTPDHSTAWLPPSAIITALENMNMSEQARHAIKAVSIYKTCGRYAASQYASRHGVYPLYRIARQLEAVQ